MPGLHWSVTLCACNVIVAVSEMHPCEGGCGKRICSSCAIEEEGRVFCSAECSARAREERAAGVLCITVATRRHQNNLYSI